MLKGKALQKAARAAAASIIRRDKPPVTSAFAEFMKSTHLSPAFQAGVLDTLEKPRRWGLPEKIVPELETIPEREFERISNIKFKDLGPEKAGQFMQKDRRIRVSPDVYEPGTIYHEFAHARQYVPKFSSNKEIVTMLVFKRLSAYMPYASSIVERHAYAFEKIMRETGGKAPYDEVFRDTARELSRKLVDIPTVAKWMEKKGITSKDLLIGALAASGVSVAGLIDPEEAEAINWGKGFKWFKGIFKKKAPVWMPERKVTKMGVSSAEEVLQGRMLHGKVISKVEKEGGDFRVIRFEGEDQVERVHKTYIHDLVRKMETDRYIDGFNQADDPDRYIRAMNSLRMRERSAVRSKEQLKDLRKQYSKHVKRLGRLGERRGSYVLVQRADMFFGMPKEYAEHLEKLGELKILEELK